MHYILFDLEATCWLGHPPVGNNEIIEIGAYKVNGYGEITDHFNQYIKPVSNPILSGFCKKLTGIQQHNVDTAYKFDKVIEDFLQWLDDENDEYYLISWGENDKQLFRQDCNLHNIQTRWLNNWVNLKPAYQRLTGMQKQLGLKKALERETIDFEGKQHRAITDAYNLTKLFIKHFDDWEL
ncbi:MAG: exonuclease domain-containing protein [Saprospiraceae bacterium]|nr:exonuclease domain-containing protein [Saprospiraceae bacterium]